MTKKILSFEEYATSKNFTSAEEVTETDDDKVLGISDEDSESEEHEKIEGEEEEKEDDDEDDDDDDKENAEEAEDKVEQVSELMKKCYEYAVTEVCEYHKDDYPDHTVESYLKENAALVAMLATKALEEAHAILDPEELTVEMYEAILNNMKESYNKKIDELKEAWSSK